MGLLACLGVPASAAAHDLPDLVADPPARPNLLVDADESGEERLLLRFDGHVHNEDGGPLEVRRTPTGIVEQVLRDGISLDEEGIDPMGADTMKFEDTDGHNHWHLQRIARYSLYDATGTAPVAPVMKVGFCLMDSTDMVHPEDEAVYEGDGNCGAWNPKPTTSIVMGVSAGWRDLYDYRLPFQYVDISETQPGSYRLWSEIDPFDLVQESDEVNNLIPGETPYSVPGYLAMPGDMWPDVDGIAHGWLQGNQFGTSVGTKRFKIVDPPQHGTLTVPTGEWFTGEGFTYDGDGTPDRFRYVADDARSDYPRWPARATVLVGHDPQPRVAMWGVPEKLRAGMSVDLSALARQADTNLPVTWSVTPGVGATIDANGILTAPATVPPGRKITVTATIQGGTANDAMDIEITPPPPPPKPAPVPDLDDTPEDVPPPPGDDTPPGDDAPRQDQTTPPTPPVAPKRKAPRRRTPIGSVRVRKIGPQLSIAIVPRASGRVRATLLRGKRKAGTCSVRVRANRSSLCRLRFRRGARTIALTLVRRDGKIERRRVKVPGARS